MFVAQLSDCHFTTGPLGGERAAGFARALGRVLALDRRPDCVVVTGDVADHGRPAEYAQLAEVLAGYPIPVHLVTGNHDASSPLLATFSGTPMLGHGETASYTVEYPTFTLIVLDSLVPGSGHGELGTAQLDRLDEVLTARPAVPALVALHHPPIPVGPAAIDGIRLADGPALGAVIERHPHVARVLAGHVHRSVTAAFAGTTLTVAPSTDRAGALHFAPDAGFGYEDDPAAFLVHLLVDGVCVTHTVYVEGGAPLGGWFDPS